MENLAPSNWVKLVVFVPDTHLEPVKQALFAAGAGRQGDYSQCCWQTLGQGQFLPAESANPFIGQAGAVAQVPEYRVEMLCHQKHIEKVIQALHQAHPYEEIAFDLLPLLDFM